MAKTTKANIKTVAKLAGVSIATVSRALKSPEIVSKLTLEKVQHAVAASGYTPNSAGRMLRTQRSGNIVVIFPDITRPFNGGIINSIELAAHDLGYSLLLGNTRGQRSRERAHANMVMSGQADGMIVLSHNLPLDLNPDLEIEDQLPPLVNASEPIDAPGFPKVLINNVTAAETAVNHLIELGHRNIAIITGEMESPSARDRLEGYYQALQKAGIFINSSYIQHGNYCVESGTNCTYRLLQQRPRPTAIFCCDDEMAIAAMQAAKTQGLSVPKNISVVGFDDIWCSEHQNPPLTTIRQPVNEMGTIAVNLLFDLINDNPCESTTTYLPVELIPRASSGPVDPSA